MQEQRPSTVHSFRDFNRGMQTHRYIKPTICSWDFLTTQSLDLRPEKDWGHHLAKATSVEVSTIVELNLEFSNIQSTYGLGYLRSCQKLKLNNNIISRIIGLDDLKVLKILDLSFNSIERIEGLSKCVELQELLLFHNTISKIEGMATLKKLVVLNLGCNQVKDLLQIHALRHLPAIRSLSLERNPVCKVPNFREYIIVWISQLRCLDWKRILPPMRTSASEMFKEKYRSFVSKERSDEKRRVTQANVDKEANQKAQLNLIPKGGLFPYLNPSEEELHYFINLIPEGEAAFNSYRQQLEESGVEVEKKFAGLYQTMRRTPVCFDARLKRSVDNYAACGKILVEGFIAGKYRHIEAVKEEVDASGKERLRQYCRLIDDVSHDLTKLLMQLELKIEEIIKTELDRFSHRIAQEHAWMDKEVEILVKFEQYLFNWAVKSQTGDKLTKLLTEEEIKQIRLDFVPEDDSEEVGFSWLDILKEKCVQDVMKDRIAEKSEKLEGLSQHLLDRLNGEVKVLSDALEERLEKIFHCRMQEILDFVEQHKAEAFQTRERSLARHGRHEVDEEQNTVSEVRSGAAQPKKPKPPPKQPATGAPGGRLKRVEFESDEPLADYIVMKDIKDVVDQIAHIPLEDRKRLFETRVVDVDDIADHVHVRDELDEKKFVRNMKSFKISAHSLLAAVGSVKSNSKSSPKEH